MTITPEQRTYARLAGIATLLKIVLELSGDSVTIITRMGKGFAETARFATEYDVLWRVALLQVGLAWMASTIVGFALYVALEPVSKRLAQLGLILRLGTSFVGASSLMFRFAQARLYEVAATEGLFSTEQLRALVAVAQRGTNCGVTIAWMLLGGSSVLFFVLFLRSRYLPRALAGAGVVTSALLVPMAVGTFLFPHLANQLKLIGIPGLLTEIAIAVRLVFKGLAPRPSAETRV